MSVPVDGKAFRRMLRERGMTGEALRKRLQLSPSTLAKLFRGAAVRDDVFLRVVEELERLPIRPVARELVGAAEGAERPATEGGSDGDV